jgi:hypothetical protein
VTDPTTPTAAQLRQDAEVILTALKESYENPAIRQWIDEEWCGCLHRAAAALDAEAARLEREASATPHAELRGWGVMRPDGTLDPECRDDNLGAEYYLVWKYQPTDALGERPLHPKHEDALAFLLAQGYRTVLVRLTTEGAE